MSSKYENALKLNYNTVITPKINSYQIPVLGNIILKNLPSENLSTKVVEKEKQFIIE